jgi:hypothetical protein
MQMFTDVSQEQAASIFRIETGGSMLLQNASKHHTTQHHTAEDSHGHEKFHKITGDHNVLLQLAWT